MYDPPDEELLAFGIPHMRGKAEFFRPVGCDHCGSRGYTGRIGIFELMTVSKPMRRLMTQSPTSDQIRDIAVSEGMKTMRDHALERVYAGQTSLDEIKKKVFFGDDD